MNPQISEIDFNDNKLTIKIEFGENVTLRLDVSEGNNSPVSDGYSIYSIQNASYNKPLTYSDIESFLKGFKEGKRRTLRFKEIGISNEDLVDPLNGLFIVSNCLHINISVSFIAILNLILTFRYRTDEYYSEDQDQIKSDFIY